jgi:hypothetical protein
MQGTLARGEFVRLAYRLGHGAATGELTLHELDGPGHRLHLRRGYLVAAEVEGHWAPLGELLRAAGEIDGAQLARSLEAIAAGPTLQGRALVAQGATTPAAVDAALRRQADLRLERLAAIAGGRYRLGPPADRAPAAGGRPVALAPWARRHVEAAVNAISARALAGELAGARIRLRRDLLPEPAMLDATDRRVLGALASPRRLDEVERDAGAPRFRLLAFLHFLRVVGAAELVGVASARPRPADDGAEPWRRLGLEPGADPDAIRRAYLRLARALHPDRHPDAEEDRRRDLAARFAEVTEAYRRLVAHAGSPRL